MFPPSFQDGLSLMAIPDTTCLANFQLSLRDEGSTIAPDAAAAGVIFSRQNF